MRKLSRSGERWWWCRGNRELNQECGEPQSAESRDSKNVTPTIFGTDVRDRHLNHKWQNGVQNDSQRVQIERVYCIALHTKQMHALHQWEAEACVWILYTLEKAVCDSLQQVAHMRLCNPSKHVRFT